MNDIFKDRRRPWDGLGTQIGQANSWKEAMELAGLDWEVRQEDIYTEDDISIPGYKANVKADDGTVLGIVSDKYRLVSNFESFAFLEELLKFGARFDCAGVVHGGRKTWVSMRLSDYIIAGERHTGYLLATNSFDGSSSVRLAVVSLRVICANSITIALSKAQRCWYMTHSASVGEKLEAAKGVLLHAENYLECLGSEIEELHRKLIPEEKAMELIDELFPIKEDMSKVQIGNVQKIRNDVKYRYKNAPDLVGLKESSWRLYNCISDHLGHSEPLRKTENYKETLLLKAVDGNPILDKAYQLIKAA